MSDSPGWNDMTADQKCDRLRSMIDDLDQKIGRVNSGLTNAIDRALHQLHEEVQKVASEVQDLKKSDT